MHHILTVTETAKQARKAPGMEGVYGCCNHARFVLDGSAAGLQVAERTAMSYNSPHPMRTLHNNNTKTMTPTHQAAATFSNNSVTCVGAAWMLQHREPVMSPALAP